MKILYLDLSPWIIEDYSVDPIRYGGGRIFASLMKEMDDFFIMARKECFENVGKRENSQNCIFITENDCKRINNGERLIDICPVFSQFDLIITPHPYLYINTEGLRARQAAWCLGYQEKIDRRHTNILIYNNYQQEEATNAKKHLFQLGIKMPVIPVITDKEDYIFQCSRHFPDFNSIEIAQFAIKNKIKCYFAGIIIDNYPLLNWIDNKYTHWLGEISEDDKRKYTHKARLCAFMHNWPTPMSLGAVQSMAWGTPVVACYNGFWPSLIQEGVNGFYAHNEDQLLEAWNQAAQINQRACWSTVAFKYNSFNMIDSLQKIFYNIVNGDSKA